MFNWLFTLSSNQLLYGVPPPGPSPFDIFMMILKFVMLPIVIPVVLTIGILVYMKKKAYSITKRVWAVIIMLTIYFALFIGAGFLFNWF